MIKATLWRPELELGVDMMDRHHRRMVTLCGEMAHPGGGRGGSRAASELFLELVGLTAMHFEAEEELMRRSDYPGRMDHQDRHHELSRLLLTWERRARCQTVPLNSSFLQHLNQWVENHILGSDKGFSRFLLGRDGADPTERLSRRKKCSVVQTAVAFKPISCDRFAQSQPGRRRFNRFAAGIEHF
ncbi:MAG: hemerythrin family protein [Elusimicrobia bacterium]|nr:hemerythrin family protein [Elusimicrobiota bacterium]